MAVFSGATCSPKAASRSSTSRRNRSASAWSRNTAMKSSAKRVSSAKFRQVFLKRRSNANRATAPALPLRLHLLGDFLLMCGDEVIGVREPRNLVEVERHILEPVALPKPGPVPPPTDGRVGRGSVPVLTG